jgi:hypothetical protein
MALSPTLTAFAQVANEKLFFIQRSKNKNEVHYDARVVKADQSLDPKDPIDAYWLRKDEDGRKAEITLPQRIAYGYDVELGPSGRHTMKLKAFPERPLTLVRANNKWQAAVTIAGRRAYLRKLYVATDESGVFPKVLYVDIFGEDMINNKPLQERVTK